jgi:sulfur-oxidizing protein SoxZ
MNKPKIKLPDVIKAGDVIDVKAVITHPMETGNRKDADGKPIPRSIIHTVVATFEGSEVFRATFGPGISANPFISFSMRVPGPGTLVISWTDDTGETLVESTPVTVVG